MKLGGFVGFSFLASFFPSLLLPSFLPFDPSVLPRHRQVYGSLSIESSPPPPPSLPAEKKGGEGGGVEGVGRVPDIFFDS